MYRLLPSALLTWGLMLCLALLPTAAAQTIGPDDGALQDHVDAAEPGAVLTLAPGTYQGGITVDKPLTLKGEPGAVIDAAGEGDVIRVESSDVRIEGLTLRRSGFNLTDMNSGIYAARGSHNLHVEGNTLEDVAFGVWVWHSESPTIVNNRITGDPTVRSQDRGDAIRLYNVSGGLVAFNTVQHARDGVYIDTSREVEFRSNHFSELRYGIHYMYSHHGRIVDNTTTRTRSGYALMMSNHLEVVGNRSLRDHNYGILLNFVNYSTIQDNLVDRVTGWAGGSSREHGVTLGSEGKAIFIYNSHGNSVSDNLFARTEIGIHLTAGSNHNQFHGNSFIANQHQVMYVANREEEWSHEGRGNYWSDYLGWDLAGDGIGDTPYEPNDAMDGVLWKYPMAKILTNSPAVQLLRWVQRQFPVLRPSGVRDSAPLIAPPHDLEVLK